MCGERRSLSPSKRINLKPAFRYHLVLFEPEIPPNTGNAGRLAVATQSVLHLVGKLGFSIDDKEVRRAGLDYWKHVELYQHEDFDSWLKWHSENTNNAPFFLFSKNAKKNLYETEIPKEAAFVFGKETKGLPPEIIAQHGNGDPEKLLKIPMFSDKIRSLNLANAVSIVLYEAIRQQIRL